VTKLNAIAVNGKGVDYVSSVIRAYIYEYTLPGFNDASLSVYPVTMDVMSGLGVFSDNLVYKEAIVRKLGWLVIRMNLIDELGKLYPGKDPQWLGGLVNACMDLGSSDWHRLDVMKIQLPKILEQLKPE